MDLDPLRTLEHVHGHVGWLGAALLVHPAILLRDRKRRAHVAVGASTAIVTAGAALGTWLYVGYRAELKREIFQASPAMGLLFERKEHLAFAAVMLAWAGCGAYFAATRASDELRPTLRTIASRAFAGAAAFAIAVAVLGTWVAIYKGF